MGGDGYGNARTGLEDETAKQLLGLHLLEGLAPHLWRVPELDGEARLDHNLVVDARGRE